MVQLKGSSVSAGFTDVMDASLSLRSVRLASNDAVSDGVFRAAFKRAWWALKKASIEIPLCFGRRVSKAITVESNSVLS